jgi:hypothetical protein
VSLVETETIFGRLVTGAQVEDWVFAVLERWSCTYLSELERQYGLKPGSLPDVRAWVPTTTFDKWPEDQLPAIFVAVNGTSERPLKNGDGGYRVRWQVRVGALCSAATQAQATTLRHLYVTAHKAIVLQRPSLDGHANGVDWLGYDYAPLDYNDTRTLAGGWTLFTVEVDDACFANAGPVTPDDPKEPCGEPWEPWMTVRLVDIDMIKDGAAAENLVTKPDPVREEE